MSVRLAALDPVTRGWAVVTGAGIARLALGFVASLVIARVLGPADFGVYSVLAATVGIVGALAEGGLTEAAVLRISAVWPGAAPATTAEPADDRRLDSAPGGAARTVSRWADDPSPARARARCFFWLRVGLAAVAIAFVCLAAGPLARGPLSLPDDGTLLRWALLGIVATASSGAVSAMLQATGGFGRMSLLTLTNAALTAVLALALAVVGHLNLLSALVVLGIGTSLACFSLGYRLLPDGWGLRPPALVDLRAEAVHLVRVGRWLWLAGIFAMLATNLDLLVLNRWASPATVGAYALALNLATKADVVNHSLYTVLLPGVARLGGRRGVRAYLRQGFIRSGLIAVGLLLLIPLAEPFILLVYGHEFAPAIGLFRLLVGVAIFDVLTTPGLLLALASRRPQLLAAGDALRAATLGVVAVGLVPTYGGVGAVGARLAARVAGAALIGLMLGLSAVRGRAQRTDPG